MQLDILEGLARAATPGPWEATWSEVTDPDGMGAKFRHHLQCAPAAGEEWEGNTVVGVGGAFDYDDLQDRRGPLPDEAYLAAVSPDVVLKLIGVARAARAIVADDVACGPNVGCELRDPACVFCTLDRALAALGDA